MLSVSNYIIITPAHNEDAFIEKTIHSVIHQRIRPLKWVIVNDASTDRTAEIMGRYAPQYSFMEVVNVERPAGRDFRNKVRAFNAGLERIRGFDCEFIGNLDADISLEPDYFGNILSEFGRDAKLGIAGGIVYTKIGDEFVTQDETLDSVGGAVQLFRRECFEQIGGYLALPHGGIDAAAEITARMKGWSVRKSPQDRVWEHRRTGTATARPLMSRIREGQRFYSLGYGALFYLLRCACRIKDRPFVLGSAAALAGYFESLIRRRPVFLPPEAVRYLRLEQREKIKRALRLVQPAVSIA